MLLLTTKKTGLLFFTFFLINSLFSHGAVDVSNINSGKISLRDAAYFLENDSLKFEYIVSHKSELRWTKASETKENLGFTTKDFWYQFELQNPSNHHLSFFLETGRPIIDSLKLYSLVSGQLQSVQLNGDAIPFNEKGIPHRKALFEIDVPAGATVQYYLWVKSDGESLMMPLDLQTDSFLLKTTYREQLFYGFFYGLLSLAFIVYLFFYFALKDRTFLYYSIYVVFIGLLQFALDGFVFQYLVPQGGWLYNRTVLIIALIGAYFLGKYAELFLDTKRLSKNLFRSYNLLYIGLGAVFVALLTYDAFLPLAYPLANIFGLGILLTIIANLIIWNRKKVKVDTFFVLGVISLVLGYVLFILNNFNAISNSFLAENAPKIGTGLEIIFLSTSMSNRIRLLRLENDRNQQLALQRTKDMSNIKSLFLSNLSHELRTPLNLIMGVTSSLSYQCADEDTNDKYNMILSSSNNLLSSIDDILNFTVIERGGHELRNLSFHFEKTFIEIINTHRAKAQEKGIELQTEFTGEIPEYIVGDKVKLEQIISNVLDNAVKFTREGNVMLRVHCTNSGENKIDLRVVVSDTGIGISQSKLQTIFESFTKRSFEDKREFSGLGLGLYISKTFIDLKGGTISLENNQRGGVDCNIGLSYYVPPKHKRSVKDEPEKRVDHAALSGCSILLVEDNLMNQMVIKMLVGQRQGVSLEIANNGQEALDCLAKNHFDVVLMDIQMPVMDGFEATAAIRAGKSGKQNSNIPIIAVTADVTDKTKKLIFGLGVNDYMTKPVDGSLLFQKISGLYSFNRLNAANEINITPNGLVSTRINKIKPKAVRESQLK